MARQRRFDFDAALYSDELCMSDDVAFSERLLRRQDAWERKHAKRAPWRESKRPLPGEKTLRPACLN